MTGDTDGTRPRTFAGMQRRSALIAVTLGLVLGGFAGGYAVSQAATATPAPSASGTPGAGVFHSNENAGHEAGESAAREAQENAGQRPTVP